MKHGDGSITAWFVAYDTRWLAIIDGSMNWELYQQIPKEKVRTSIHEINLERIWARKQDNVPKHTSRSTKERLKNNKATVLT